MNRDVQIGMRYGVSSTPTLFINGRTVIGAQSYETFAEVVREEIATGTR